MPFNFAKHKAAETHAMRIVIGAYCHLYLRCALFNMCMNSFAERGIAWVVHSLPQLRFLAQSPFMHTLLFPSRRYQGRYPCLYLAIYFESVCNTSALNRLNTSVERNTCENHFGVELVNILKYNCLTWHVSMFSLARSGFNLRIQL